MVFKLNRLRHLDNPFSMMEHTPHKRLKASPG